MMASQDDPFSMSAVVCHDVLVVLRDIGNLLRCVGEIPLRLDDFEAGVPTTPRRRRNI